MTLEETIQKAIEGGFKKGSEIFDIDGEIPLGANPELFFLDPLFWRSLENVMGWEIIQVRGHIVEAWKFKWHSFIEHLIEGKDIESFFSNL